MKKISMSKIYIILYVFIMISLGVSSFLYGSIFNEYIVFSMFGVIGISIIVAMIIFENQMSFMDLSRVPNIEPEPKKDSVGIVRDYIMDNLKQGIELSIITNTLQRSGYEIDFIAQVVNLMVKDGLIVLEKKEQPKKKTKKVKKHGKAIDKS